MLTALLRFVVIQKEMNFVSFLDKCDLSTLPVREIIGIPEAVVIYSKQEGNDGCRAYLRDYGWNFVKAGV